MKTRTILLLAAWAWAFTALIRILLAVKFDVVPCTPPDSFVITTYAFTMGWLCRSLHHNLFGKPKQSPE